MLVNEWLSIKDMNLIETLQKLDKLILDGTSISEQRALINSMIEQCEAHAADSEEHARLKLENAKLITENTELKRPTFPKKIKLVSDRIFHKACKPI